ncbi:NAD(P)/FAD-dependent oxidoreductase [Microvirga sp. RSM25]|jgi:thioredoxin reductase|uniref:NAD(P)/FAD-dependent oxidoreductase n=1 Tax=Microvirga sp. RSM25 TaxID=3273802 RepID=UPI00384CD406
MISSTPIDVLVIGGGPAGLAAATELRARGVVRVVVVEREKQAGGVPRHCGHPPFGMREFKRVMTGPSYARRLTSMAERAGVEVLTEHTVVSLEPGGAVNISSDEGSFTINARRVVIATGVRETPRSARLISGDRPLGILNTGALQAYVYLHRLLPFRNPVIVGTELVSLSAILTCLKAGAKPVAMIEKGHHPVAQWPLHLAPKLLGIPLYYRAEIADIRGRNRVDAVDIRREDGTITTLSCDGILFTGEFIPEASLIRASHLRLDDGSGGPEVDQYGRCSDPSYYACGNVLHPVETAGWSFREGQRIGGLVADDLTGMLASGGRSLTIRRGRGIKYVVPQRLSLPIGATGLPELQLRATGKVVADLRVKADGRDVWARRLSTFPERRVLISLNDLEIPGEVQELTVTFDSEADRS